MNKFETGLTSLLVVAALGVAAAAIKREFFPAPSPSGLLADSKVPADTWRRLLSASQPVGVRGSGSTIVVLTDLECPACKLFHNRLMTALANESAQVEVRYAHLPLPYHESALPAAKLFECLSREGGLGPAFADAVFKVQDSLGVLPWGELARRSGSTAPAAAVECATTSDSLSFARIWEGITIATELEVRGTPAVIVDGVLLGSPPNDARLRELVKSR